MQIGACGQSRALHVPAIRESMREENVAFVLEVS
jgi:hypothetical protein